MRVVCIDESCQDYAETDIPRIKRGCVYTVIEESNEPEEINETSEFIFTVPSGIYYTLLECGSESMYHSEMFIAINEDQQDETEFEREVLKDKVIGQTL